MRTEKDPLCLCEEVCDRGKPVTSFANDCDQRVRSEVGNLDCHGRLVLAKTDRDAKTDGRGAGLPRIFRKILERQRGTGRWMDCHGLPKTEPLAKTETESEEG
jgi:hypothetical protein